MHRWSKHCFNLPWHFCAALWQPATHPFTNGRMVGDHNLIASRDHDSPGFATTTR